MIGDDGYQSVKPTLNVGDKISTAGKSRRGGVRAGMNFADLIVFPAQPGNHRETASCVLAPPGVGYYNARAFGHMSFEPPDLLKTTGRAQNVSTIYHLPKFKRT